MRSRLPILLGGFVCLLVSVIAAPLLAHPSAVASVEAEQTQAVAQQPQAPQPNTLQVGVPQGRQGAPRQGGPGRGRQAGPPQPPPRNTDGRVLLGSATPKQRNGVWLPSGGGPVSDANIKEVPFQPWARGVLADRDENQLEPHTRCKPSGVTRPFLTPYGVEFVELNELKRIYIFDIGGPHTYRTIYMDGRTHPANLSPSYYGHSIGWWEGDTLVVDTIGFNEGFWIDRGQLPHTEQLHLLEKYTRTSVGAMRYEVTVDDPGAYTKPFTGTSNLRWEDGTELFEYVCQQANQAYTLMVGEGTSVDRTTLIVP